MKITKAARWIDKATNEIRFFIEAVDEAGKRHNYTRYITGNHWNPARTWGTDNGAEGQPPAEVVSEYKKLTDGGRKVYYAPTTRITSPADDAQNELDAVSV